MGHFNRLNKLYQPNFFKGYGYVTSEPQFWHKNEKGVEVYSAEVLVDERNNNVIPLDITKSKMLDYLREGAWVNIEGIIRQFDNAGRFNKGMAAIRQGRSYGFINKDGKLIINPQFDNASFFSDGLAAVQSSNKFGYINKDGKYEINTQFDYAGDFYNGIALVRSADKWGFINKKGQYVVNPQFNRVKIAPSSDVFPDFIESDYYDTSEFIRVFFQKDEGNNFDGVSASTTLEALSDHQIYGAGLNARDRIFADFRQSIFITNDISIASITFRFDNTPIFEWINQYNQWGGYTGRRQDFNFEATPDVIVYQFNLSGKAWEKRSVVISAIKNEIERKQGQSMTVREGYNSFVLLQEGGRLSFYLDENNSSLTVAFNRDYLIQTYSLY